MDASVIIAIIGAVVSIVVAVAAPVLLLYMTGKQQEAAKKLEWARQDVVTARLVDNNAKLVTLQHSADAIHILVNSNLTAQMISELDATERELVALREIIELKRASGVEPTDEAQRVIAATVARIAEMRLALSHRLQQQKVLDELKP